VICTTFYPTTYFTERLVGGSGGGAGGVEVRCLLPEGADPAFWQPGRESLAEYHDAAMVVVNGAGFEKWVATAALAESRVVDTTAGMAGELIVLEGVVHSHGPAGMHSHAGTDGHTWVDPENAKAQAARIAGALRARWPEKSADVDARMRALEKDLDSLGARCAALAGLARGAVLVASHPAYNYLSRRYGLGVVSLALDPETPLDDAAVREIGTLVERGASGGARVMLWEEEPLAETARLLEERFGMKSVVFDPAESLGAEERAAGADYLTIMRGNLDRLERALGR
jgi:zinc transport system substrate-binding protein